MTDWSTLKKLIWLRIIKGGGSALRTVTGAIVHVINALARPAISVKCEVNPIQDLHGYDRPWPAGGGVSKCPSFANGTHTMTNGLTVTIQDGEITINGTASDSGYYEEAIESTVMPADAYVSFNNPVGTYNIAYVFINGNTQIASPSTAPANATKQPTGLSGATVNKLRIFCNAATYDNFKMSPIVHDGSTPQAWQPYSNICPISGRTSATVTRTGKNLINIDAPEGIPNPTAVSNTTSPRVLEFGKFYKGLRSDNYYYPQYATYSISNGVLTVSNGSNNAYGVAYSLKVSPGDSITISAIASNPLVGVGFYDSDWNFIAQSTVYSDLPRAYVVPANAYCAVVVFRAPANGTATYENIQIELGSTASAYEPYAGNTYTIQLGDTVYGGTLDVTAGKLTATMAMVDLGTLNWQYDSVANYKNFWAYGFTVIAPPPNNGEKANILCSNYKTITANEGYLGTELIGIAVAINQRLFVYDPNYSDAATFKTAMSGVQLCYELAQPFEITLTPTQIDMLLGENNVWADAGDLTLTYYADGNASTSEALGILLGGTYNNPGGADDVSDDEALGILLGGS